MKIALLIGLNALVVGAGLLAYDVLRSGGEAHDAEQRATAARMDEVLERLDGLAGRIDALERGAGQRRLSTRLLHVEDRVGALEARRSIGAAQAAPAADDPAAAAAASAPTAADAAARDGDAPLAEKEIERVKEALALVEAERAKERSARMVDGLVSRLGLQLTDEQRARLADELAAFRETARDTFRNARGSGMTREDVMATFDTLRSDLTTQLEEFLPATDASAVTEALGQGPRMLFGGGPGGGGGGDGRSGR